MDRDEIERTYANVFPELRKNLVDRLKSLGSPPLVIQRLEESLDANTQTGRQTRALAVPQLALALQGAAITSTQLRELCILGWLVQLQTSYILIADDIVDRSTTRRGRPTWWARPEIGPSAVSDAFVLNFCIYHLLKHHFSSHPTYLDLLHLFLENSLLVEIGQSADNLMSSGELSSRLESNLLHGYENENDKWNNTPGKFDYFTEENYDFIVAHKGGHFFILGAVVALVYTGLGSRHNKDQLMQIGLAFGKYAQIQDDFLDAFADPIITGKIGTDIQEGKCTWLIIQALKRCNRDQRKLLENAYGRRDEVKVQQVKQLYRDLELDKVYESHEAKALAQLQEMIAKVDDGEGLRQSAFDIMPMKNAGYRNQRETIRDIRVKSS